MSYTPPPGFPPMPPAASSAPPAGPGAPQGSAHPGTPATGPKAPNGLATASLIVGIVAFVGAFIPLFNYVAGLIALVGLVLGIVALVLKGRKKGAAIAGVIINSIAIMLSVALAIVYTFVFFGGVIQTIEDQVNETGEEVSLIYQVDGTGSDVTITYTTYDDGIAGTAQSTGESLPFEEEDGIPLDGAYSYNSYTITATNGAEDGDVTCRIILDGQVLIEQSASGAYATASCTANGTDLSK